MKRLLPLLLLAACSVPPVPRTAPTTEVPAGLCRVGPDGGLPIADRGIGGTGSPVRTADRGIGGTGAPSRTGILGVITGFASVCLAGQEVEYGADLPVQVDGRSAGLDALRAGQVAVVVADGARPVAASLAVRHEVSGPVERIEPDGALRVAGQRVLPPAGAAVPQPGSFVLVSGFRRMDGSIVATRLDARGPGEVLVRGVMRIEAGTRWIGLLEIRPGRFQERRDGVPVVAIGRLNDGVLDADTVEVDALLLDPPSFFGPTVGVLVLEGYEEGGFVNFGRGLRVGAPFGSGRTLTRLERGPGGQFAPAFVRPRGGPSGFGSAPRAAFGPAPVPNHMMDRAGTGTRREGGDAGRGGERRERGGAGEQGRRDGERQIDGTGAGPGPGGFGSGGFGSAGFGQGGGSRGPAR